MNRLSGIAGSGRRVRLLLTFAPAGFVVLMAVAAALSIAASGDTTADRVLGQLDFAHAGVNLVDGRGFSRPAGFAVDTSVSPNRIYVADSDNNRVLGWSDVSSLTNGAAADLVIGQPDFLSNGSSAPSGTSLSFPIGLAVDGSGNLYVADRNNNRVLEFDSPYTNDTTADRVFGQAGDFTTSFCNGADGLVTATTLCAPVGVTVDGSGHLYIADGNSRVLEYDTPLDSQTANRVFGQSGSFTTAYCDGADGVTVSNATLCGPNSVAVDGSGNVYIADTGNSRVLEYNTPLSTDTTADEVFGQVGDFTTSACGSATADTLCDPEGVAVDTSSNLYVADKNNDRVLEYDTPLSKDTTADKVFGQGGVFTTSDCNSGGVSADTSCEPDAVAADSDGNLYVVEDGPNNRVLKYVSPLTTDLTPDLELGQHDFTHATENLVDGSSLNNPGGVALDTSVTPNRLYVADESTSRVLGWADASAFMNGAPADLVIGQPDIYSADCKRSQSASTLCGPGGLAVDSVGNLYVADFFNNRVLEYNSPFTTDTTADMVFGQNGSFSSNVCDLSAGGLCNPNDVAVDGAGNVYVADTGNDRVLEYNTPLSTDTTADRVFGEADFVTDDRCSSVTANSLCEPFGVAVDGGGNLYVSDEGNSRVLEYNSPLATNTTADRVFGQGGDFTTSFCDGSDGATLNADTLCDPNGLAVDASGNLYVSDVGDNRILEYNIPLVLDTTADQVFGQNGDFTTSFCNGSDGLTTSADSLCGPVGVALDSANNLYVGDLNNNRVLEYDQPIVPPPSPTPTPTATATATATATPTATPTPGLGKLSFSPKSLNFGKKTTVGKISKAKKLKIKNASSKKSKIKVMITGETAAAPFAVKTQCIKTLAPGKTCNVSVTFTPPDTTPQSGELIVNDDAMGAPQMIPLSGTGKAPKK